MHTKPRLVLLDSDVVITLHEIGVWDSILSRYEVWMTETMVSAGGSFFTNHEVCKSNLRTPVLNLKET